MNFKEGVRRLALLLGGLGAILGGFVSYTILSEALIQSAHHNKFERIAHSNSVIKARMKWISARIPPDYDALAKRSGGSVAMFGPDGKVRDVPIEDENKVLASGGEWAIRFTAPNGTKLWVRESEMKAAIKAGDMLDGQGYSDQQKLLAVIWETLGAKKRDEFLAQLNPEQKHALRTLVEFVGQEGVDWFTKNAPVPPSEVNTGRIRTIRWSRKLGVVSIETADGQKLFPTPGPRTSTYLLIGFLPVLGFILPWGAIRAIGWVGVGFAAHT